MANISQVPTLGELAQYNVNRPDAIEAVKQSLYDTATYASAGQSQLSFFQTPNGQGGKTLADTNMEAAGLLPNPKSFLCQNIQIFFFPGVNPGVNAAANAAPVANYLNDLYTFYKYGSWIQFFIGSKDYLIEATPLKFPPMNGLSGFTATSQGPASTNNVASLVNYATAAGPIYELDPPLLLPPMQNFKFTINYPAALSISANASVQVSIGGILYRNSQ